MSNRTPADIEAQMSATRKEMTATVDQLVEALDPRKSLDRTKEEAKFQAAELQDKAKDTIDDARAGDKRALAIVAGVAVAGLVIGGLLIRKLLK